MIYCFKQTKRCKTNSKSVSKAFFRKTPFEEIKQAMAHQLQFLNKLILNLPETFYLFSLSSPLDYLV